MGSGEKWMNSWELDIESLREIGVLCIEYEEAKSLRHGCLAPA
jgi:hypothetical protein